MFVSITFPMGQDTEVIQNKGPDLLLMNVRFPVFCCYNDNV